MSSIRAWAAPATGSRFEPYGFEAGPLGPEVVDIAVEHCGVCHTDLTMLDDELGLSRYPLVPGHEAVGRVVALGEYAKGLAIGQRVGVGFMAESCMHCQACLAGDQHLCPTGKPTIVGRHGGFAERVRVHWGWAIPLPDVLPLKDIGPLLCAGVTVVAPLLALGIGPAHRLGVVGIGGLGHLALKFYRAWGCEVTAFTSSEAKREEAKVLGAHRVVSSRDRESMRAIAGSLDFILDTINVPLDWDALMGTLAPKGRLHLVGALLEPLPLNMMGMIFGQKTVSGSPVGSRGATDTMLAFAARHGIVPQVEHFPMSRINDAFDHLREGKARYRVVLDADFAS
jgi:uncharacterized zinc-type alcohol dehydrogenase-like protein